MAVWVVRTGFTKVTLSQGVICAGWDLDVSGVSTYDELEARCRETWPEARRGKGASRNTQILDFCHRMQADDLVIMPRDWEDTFSLGRVAGSFEYRDDLPRGGRMTRPVEWLAEGIPSSRLSDDVRHLLRTNLAVRCVHHRTTDAAVLALANGDAADAVLEARVFPAEEAIAPAMPLVGNTAARAMPATPIKSSVEQDAYQQIRQAMARTFPGSDLIRLLKGLLVAQGYQSTGVSRDARFGADLVGYRPHAGQVGRRVYVRVLGQERTRSADTEGMASERDITDFHEAMNRRGAAEGILVSWQGFREEAIRAALRVSAIRLRSANDIVDAVLDHYEMVPQELRVELPLKRIWIPIAGEPT